LHWSIHRLTVQDEVEANPRCGRATDYDQAQGEAHSGESVEAAAEDAAELYI